MRTKLFFIALIAITALPSCKEEGADVRPGLWFNQDLISVFPGQVLSLKGQASCYTGLQSLTFTCPEWGLADTTRFTEPYPKVWNLEKDITVPMDASFPASFLFVATDNHGTQMKQRIAVRYAPCTQVPIISGLATQIGVDFDTITSSGTYSLQATLTAEGILQKAVVEVPAIDFKQEFMLSGNSQPISTQIPFTAIDVYPMTLTVTDCSNNCTSESYELIVIPPENQDEVGDYDQLFCYHASIQESDYLYGFYQYVRKDEVGGYWVSVYAESDEDAFFFTPTQEMSGERLFGISPYVSSRFISKQSEPGYVKPIRTGKGYWTIYVEPDKGRYSISALDCSTAMTEQLYASADWNSWSTSDAMSRGATDYQQYTDVTIHTTDQWFAFYTAQTPIDWTRIWRVWYGDAGKTIIGGWFFAEDGTGDGGTLPTITEDTPARVYFDTAIMWSWIIKN